MRRPQPGCQVEADLTGRGVRLWERLAGRFLCHELSGLLGVVAACLMCGVVGLCSVQEVQTGNSSRS